MSLIESDSRLDKYTLPSEKKNDFVMPGEFLIEESGMIKGYNTYNDKNAIYSSVMGYSEKIDKLVCVNPSKSRYHPEVGDIVVGRIVEVSYKRWSANIDARLYAHILLTSVNLPGSEMRKKTRDDALKMSNYLKENDLFVAEVQSVKNDQATSLHMRSARYGKLPQGILVKVPNSLCRKNRSQICKMDPVVIILAANGWIWIGPSLFYGLDLSFQPRNLDFPLTPEIYATLSRYRNLIKLFTKYRIPICQNLLSAAFDFSKPFQVNELLTYQNSIKIYEHIRGLM